MQGQPGDRTVRQSQREPDGSRSITVEGTVREALPNAMFSVELSDGRKVIGHMPGETRTRYVRLLPGDRVKMDLSPYDLTRGRITHRLP